ncbi:MAG: hypothetical protein ACK5P5_11855 [Pseudobdellovibrionaceae bacterium]
MSQMEFDVTIVSCFDRSYWLALEFQSRGMRVCFIDVTEDMGLWPPEDVEGPFGYFAQEKTPSSYLQIMDRLTALRSLSWGLCIWASSKSIPRLGPLQMKSSIFKEQMQMLQIDPPNGEALVPGPFSKNWLKLFVQQFGVLSLCEQGATIAPRSDQAPFNAIKDFMIRSPVRSDYQKLRHELIDRGVTYLSGSEVVDLSFLNSKSVDGIELKNTNSGLVRFDELVWCLNSDETKFLDKKIFRHLFTESIEPMWSWVRYRIKMKSCFELGLLPEHFVLIQEIYEPWTHSNFMIVQRTPIAEQMDFWLKIPSLQRFNKNYLRFRELHLLEAIVQKLPLAQPEVLSYPQEYFYTADELGPSLFSEYDFQSYGKSPQKQLRNVHFMQSIQQTKYSMEERYLLEKNILDRVVKSWELKLELKRKQEKKNEEGMRT